MIVKNALPVMERVTLPIDFRLANEYRRTFGSIPVARESNVREKRTARYGAGDFANRFSIG
jgi:hypothetical protein